VFDSIIASSPVHISIIFKFGILVILAIYLVFLFVILKQVQSMNKVVTQPYLYPFLLLVSWGLIILGLALFGISVIIL